MGCGQSSGMETSSDPEFLRSKEIDRELAQDREKGKDKIKMLLLGSGESGKTTVIRQMRRQYAQEYSTAELLEYKSIIISNLIQSMQAVMRVFCPMSENLLSIAIREAASELSSGFKSEEETAWSLRVMQADWMGDQMPTETANALEKLTKTSLVAELLTRSNEFQLNDSASYFFKHTTRITRHDYVPSVEDVLRSRVKTTGISENHFQIDRQTFVVLDVGGQRSERRKWIQCFSELDVLLFLFSVSEFDQRLYENQRVRRFDEAMTVFKEIVNSPLFKDTLIILLLNKVDLLEQKLTRKQFSQYDPGFTGENTADAVLRYIQKGMEQQHQVANKKLYCHRTCATDTRTIRVVLAAVQDQIVSRLLNAALF